MGLPETFVGSITSCMNSSFMFPSITERGLPNFALACFSANLAGINYILDFIPPSMTNPPSIPSIDIFINAFLAGLNLPSSYPNISLGPLTIPAVGNPPYEYDLTGELKLLAICILIPFQLILDMITGLLNLEIKLPTVTGIVNLFISLAVSIGLAGAVVVQFATCLAVAIVTLFTSLI